MGAASGLFCDAKPRGRSCAGNVDSDSLENPASDAMDYGTSQFCEENADLLRGLSPSDIEVDADAGLFFPVERRVVSFRGDICLVTFNFTNGSGRDDCQDLPVASLAGTWESVLLRVYHPHGGKLGRPQILTR